MGLKIIERKAITKEVARRYKKAKKGREEHPPLIPPIKGGKIPLHLSPLKERK